MTTRINKAMDIFLKALEEGTLAKGSCTKCAVGNLCGGDASWNIAFSTVFNEQLVNEYSFHIPYVKDAVAKTDFTIHELMKIEFAFETNTEIFHLNYDRHTKEEVRADQLKGLTAVIEVMMDFDDVKFDVNKLFTEKAELIPLN